MTMKYFHSTLIFHSVDIIPFALLVVIFTDKAACRHAALVQ